eukprot:scaffold85449_cov65-Cyclotella_meneghiniana.AAC.10
MPSVSHQSGSSLLPQTDDFLTEQPQQHSYEQTDDGYYPYEENWDEEEMDHDDTNDYQDDWVQKGEPEPIDSYNDVEMNQEPTQDTINNPSKQVSKSKAMIHPAAINALSKHKNEDLPDLDEFLPKDKSAVVQNDGYNPVGNAWITSNIVGEKQAVYEENNVMVSPAAPIPLKKKPEKSGWTNDKGGIDDFGDSEVYGDTLESNEVQLPMINAVPQPEDMGTKAQSAGQTMEAVTLPADLSFEDGGNYLPEDKEVSASGKSEEQSNESTIDFDESNEEMHSKEGVDSIMFDDVENNDNELPSESFEFIQPPAEDTHTGEDGDNFLSDSLSDQVQETPPIFEGEEDYSSAIDDEMEEMSMSEEQELIEGDTAGSIKESVSIEDQFGERDEKLPLNETKSVEYENYEGYSDEVGDAMTFDEPIEGEVELNITGSNNENVQFDDDLRSEEFIEDVKETEQNEVQNDLVDEGKEEVDINHEDSPGNFKDFDEDFSAEHIAVSNLDRPTDFAEGREIANPVAKEGNKDYSGDVTSYHVLQPKGKTYKSSSTSATVGVAMLSFFIGFLVCCCYIRYRRRRSKPSRGKYSAIGSEDFFNGTFSDDISFNGKDSDDEMSYGSDDDYNGNGVNIELGGMHEMEANEGLTLEEING